LDSSDIPKTPGEIFGVSKSSTAKLSPLCLRFSVVLWLYVDEAREWAEGLRGGWLILALSACVSVVPTLGRPFLLVIESVALDDDRL